jgi:glycosyltransferase involved in cell wall biosynthesis
MKKALQLASVASMIDQFIIPNIELLQRLGYSVDVVANFTNPGTITANRTRELEKRLMRMGVRYYDVQIPRSISPRAVFDGYGQVKKLLYEERYDLLHCHSPIGGAIAREAGRDLRKCGLKVIYTAHGFHFYDGAPLVNWIVYYPIEFFLSRYTDVLITINKEDYKRASDHFHANRTVYVPGVGVDLEKFKPNESGRHRIRQELGLDEEDTMLLSVCELNGNKNHASVIRAIGGMGFTYVIVGKGEKRDELVELARMSDVDLRLMGFRDDVACFYNAADAYVLPSKREGLNLSLMEAMASGLPVACSAIRGNVDLIDEEDGTLFEPCNVEGIRSAISVALENKHSLGVKNLKNIRMFDISKVRNYVRDIYSDCNYTAPQIARETSR